MTCGQKIPIKVHEFPIPLFRKSAINTGRGSWHCTGILLGADTVSAGSKSETSVCPSPVLPGRLRHIGAHNVHLCGVCQHASYSSDCRHM